MVEQIRKTTFSIGQFTNGLCNVIGIILNGKLYGIVFKTQYQNYYKKYSFVLLPELYSEINEPQFKKIKSFNIISHTGNVNSMLTFLEEIADLPKCAWKYQFLIDRYSRNVLIEKHNQNNYRKHILDNYANFNSEAELILVKIIANRYNDYGTKNIKNIYQSPVRIDHKADAFANNGTISITSFFNQIHVELNVYQAMEGMFQLLFNSVYHQKMTETEIKILINKIKQ